MCPVDLKDAQTFDLRQNFLIYALRALRHEGASDAIVSSEANDVLESAEHPGFIRSWPLRRE